MPGGVELVSPAVPESGLLSLVWDKESNFYLIEMRTRALSQTRLMRPGTGTTAIRFVAIVTGPYTITVQMIVRAPL